MTTSGMGTAAAEWRKYGVLPIAAGIGYSVMGLQTYGVGPLTAQLEAEFGWTRAEVMMGLTISNGIGVLFNFAVGLLVDRFGPRRVGLLGVIVKSCAFALLATATGSLLGWSLLWVLMAVGAMLVQATVWTSAVASRFDRSRGLAFAVSLSGTSACAAIMPLLVTWLASTHGWRFAFAGAGIAWLAVVLPIVLLFFRGRQDDPVARADAEEPEASQLPGFTLAQGIRLPAYWRLLLASFVYAFYTLAISPSLVPLLTEKGASAMGAAQIASLIGIAGIVARIAAGFLLDHLPATAVGTVVFLIPVAACGLLLADAPGTLVLSLAVVGFGVTIGAEYDVVFYLVSRHFGLRSFGALIGGLLTAGALGGAVGPVTAGWIHDIAGNYDALLVLLMGMMGLGALAIATTGRPRGDWNAVRG